MPSVVICGGNEGESWLHWRAYSGQDQAAVAGVWHPDESRTASRASHWGVRAYPSLAWALADQAVHVVEVLGSHPDRTAWALSALEAGKHVLLAPPFALSRAEAGQLVNQAKTSQGRLLTYDPWLHYPPVDTVRQLVQRRTVGRLSGLRLRSLLAGLGGWDASLSPTFPAAEPPEETGRERRVFREIYEKLRLAVSLLGPIEEIHGSGVGSGEAFSSAISWKHRSHATYGVLEITEAPALRIRSAYDARDDQLEATGSAGIVWLTRGAAQMRHEPTVRVYHGQNQFAYGCLDDDWQQAYSRCALHLMAGIHRRHRRHADLELAASAVDMALSALKGGRSSHRESVSL